ncbi:hypothetical protein [Pseudomonas protegens]|uniref:hypothetical protein n=1 Tax=Pseudomonas protegens TaxID=380021 RepID=UPI0012D72F48|nr:hypothetical protein [Pseudomonas protegens]MDX9682580.1 hypothetical protein [Pseudomonas protegens]
MAFLGFSQIARKVFLDPHKKEFAGTVAVVNALNHFEAIVEPQQLASMHQPAKSAQNSSPVALPAFSELYQPVFALPVVTNTSRPISSPKPCWMSKVF